MTRPSFRLQRRAALARAFASMLLGTAALAARRIAAARAARAEGTLGAIATAMAVFFTGRCRRAAIAVLGLSFLMHAIRMGCAITHRIAGGNLGRGKLDGSR